MKIKKNVLYATIFLLILILATASYFLFFNDKNESDSNLEQEEEKIDGFVDNQGFLHYPLNREEVSFQRQNYSETDEFIVSKIIFQSRKGSIYSLLVTPKKVKSQTIPAMVLIPGAGVSKESELELAKEVSLKGIAVLTYDQRGVGETNQPVPNLEQDFAIFISQKEPYSHLVVYDALRAFDLLRGAPFVDPNKIMIAGESVGGRIAIIASAVDPAIKGTLAISTSGYNLTLENQAEEIFLKSINPNHYAKYIAPNKLALIHNVHDKNVRYELGLRLFELANDPKKFFTLNSTTCNHGYCDEMKDLVHEAVDWLLNESS